MKSIIKEKEPVALRAKELKGGRKSLYLDYYVSTDKNHAHKYEFLKLYLLPETSKENRERNKETIKVAKAIQAQRMLDVIHGKASLNAKKSTMSLVDYILYFAQRKKEYGQSLRRAETIERVAKYIDAYKAGLMIADVDKEFCIGFIRYLSTAKSMRSTKNPTALSKSTAYLYFSILVAVLNQAVREDIIDSNPTTKISAEDRKVIAPASKSSSCTYLSLEELQKLIDAKCRNDEVKKAFLFACFTGLRISDIRSLQWDDIKTENKQTFIRKQMIKTKQDVIVPIGKTAKRYLPKKTHKYVFGLPSLQAIDVELKRWAKRAGVGKTLHFHVSRHTFATTLLTKGADLYAVSKLLGHTNINTTQVYAEIVNQKRVEAIKLLDKL